MSKQNLPDHIPQVFLNGKVYEVMKDTTLETAVVEVVTERIKEEIATMVKGQPLEVAIPFVNGLLEHQDLMADPDNKGFLGTILSVEVIERKGPSGFLLGKKAVIHFEGRSRKGNGEEEQSITTDWIEYHGLDAHSQAWNVAHGNAIMAIAEDNIGKKCYFQKYVTDTEDSRVRKVIKLEPSFSSDDKSNSGKKSNRSSKRKSKPSDQDIEKFQDRLQEILDEYDEDENINDDDLKFLEELFDFGAAELSDRDIRDEVLDYLDIDKRDIEVPEEPSDDQLTWAVQLLTLNI